MDITIAFTNAMPVSVVKDISRFDPVSDPELVRIEIKRMSQIRYYPKRIIREVVLSDVPDGIFE